MQETYVAFSASESNCVAALTFWLVMTITKQSWSGQHVLPYHIHPEYIPN